MIITLRKDTSKEDMTRLLEDLKHHHFTPHLSEGLHHTIVHVVGDTAIFDAKQLYAYECVENVTRIQKPFKHAHKSDSSEKTTISIKQFTIGSKDRLFIAGPCSVESLEQMEAVARVVKRAGAHVLRGGAYKPRSSPYSFQGLSSQGLKYLRAAASKENLSCISEIIDKNDLPLFEEYVDIIQVGARNMQNFDLLKALGTSSKPIVLKRGFGNTIEEWLMSAEYIMTHGNPHVILCERGIRTFESFTRFTLDLSSVLAVKQLSHLPVIVDPSHAAGKWELVSDLAKASIAVGADGIMIEVHPTPNRAYSDGAQSLKPETFERLMADLKKIIEVL